MFWSKKNRDESHASGRRSRHAKRRASPGPWPPVSGPGRYRYHRPRRGVLLLVVLTVLVLFVMLTITYVIVATKERVATRAALRVDQSGDPPNQVLDSLAMTFFRGSNDVHNPMGTWDLLGGIYGNVSFRGAVGSQYGPLNGSGSTLPAKLRNLNSGGQFYFIGIDPDPSSTTNPKATNVLTNNGTTRSSFNYGGNYYKGCVLTMLSGPCAGCSTRIVGSNGPDTANGINAGLTVMEFKTDAAVDSSGNLLTPNPGDLFVVNGPAYAGMGRGYDPNYKPAQAAPASLAPNGLSFHDPIDSADRPYALLPNYTGIVAAIAGGGSMVNPTLYGGENVDYTAWDYNNMYLGLVTNVTTPTGQTPTAPPVLPSFHRPDLCAYWQGKGAITPSLMRQILFRPNPIDHPVFCNTTNPTFNAANVLGPYDVDNLGLFGVPDSIWIDPGLPVMTAKDGRTYKIMVAPLILDLDGRVNLNAHGSNTLVDRQVNYQQTGQYSINSAAIAGMQGSQKLPIGEGYGPAEVNLLTMFTQQEVMSLLAGNSTYQGRHGAQLCSTESQQLAGVKYFEYPLNDFRNSLSPSAQAATSFGTPPDLKGRRLLALDHRGMPLFLTTWAANGADPYNDSGIRNGSIDSNPLWENEVYGSNSNNSADFPYGFDLSAPKPGRGAPTSAHLDNPFTVAELERVMRAYDVDAKSLPPRLLNLLTQTLNANHSRALQITTDSYDVPVPSLALPPSSFLDKNGASSSYRDLARQNFTSNPPGQFRAFQLSDFVRTRLGQTAVPAANVEMEVANLLAPELLAGLRMDINRPFGNGRDDFDVNNNSNPPVAGVDGVEDQSNGSSPPNVVPGLDYSTFLPNANKPSSYPNKVPFNITNGNGVSDPLLNATSIPVAWKARQLMARHLYVLMMLFTDQGYVNWITENQNPPLSTPQKQELTARRVAQWAINAVCFRDSTSAMTPFVYHSQLFQSGYKGWYADGDPGNQQLLQSYPDLRVVWGCKPPELLLTETLAFHDRRTADTKLDPSGKTTTDQIKPRS